MDSGEGLGLAGRRVVITGGAGALGGAVVEHLRLRGAECYVPVRGEPPPALERGGPNATPGPQIRYLPGVDLTDEAAVAAFYAGVPGPLWASVHLAGGFAMSALADTTSAALRSQLEQNLVTAFLCSREAANAMRRGRAPSAGRRADGGRIVQVASRSGLHPPAGQLAYSVSKAGVVALTAGLAAELAAEGILVNAVAPGTLDTPGNRRAMPGADPGKWVSPADLASLIAWLASPANVTTSGVTIPVFGAG